MLDRLLFIGRAIDQSDVRRRRRAADEHCRTAAVANVRDELSAADVDAVLTDYALEFRRREATRRK